MLQLLKSMFVRTFQNLTLLGVSVIVALLCGELLVRYVAPQAMYRFPKGMFVNHPSLRYRLTPNFRGIMKTSEYKASIRINSLGLREDREYGRKPPGTYRILAIGDSFTMGVGVELEDTYVKALEKLLGSENNEQGYEVINAGFPGYNTLQELVYLQEEGLRLEPDLVLLNFYVGNDIYDNFDSLSSFVDDGYIIRGKPSGIIPYGLRSYLARNTQLYNFIWPYQHRLFDRSWKKREKQKLVRYLSIYMLQEDERAVGMWNATQEQLRDLANLAKRYTVKLIVVVIPKLVQTDPRRWAELLQHGKKKGLYYEPDLPNKRIVEFCKKLGVPVLDLLPIFAQNQLGERLYFELDGHWTTQGNALAAKAVHAFLRDQSLFLLDLVPNKKEAAFGVQK